MKGMLAVFKKELHVIYASPIFYAAMLIFLGLAGYFFYSTAAYFSIMSLQAGRNPYLFERLNLAEMVIKPFFSDLAIILILLLPLITMRIYAEEKKLGTIELLFTYPISDAAALMGKFAAAVVVLLTMLAGTVPYLLILHSITPVEWPMILCGYLGVMLLGTSFISFGIFTSSLTENQIVAAVVSFGALLLFWVLVWAGSIAGPPTASVLAHISFVSHLQPFTSGLIDTRHVIYFLLFSFFWLFLTLRFLNTRFWRG